MNARRLSILFCCFLCLFLSGACAHRHRPSQPLPHLLIGTIVTVNDKDRFVLIDTGNAYAIPAKGVALKSFSDGVESGVLIVSPEHKPPFLIADIVQGAPQKGDQVFQ